VSPPMSTEKPAAAAARAHRSAGHDRLRRVDARRHGVVFACHT
jgi:hypothetical protein